jgi:hypothetical protein
MTDLIELAVLAVVIGLGGSLLMDVWGYVLRRRFNVATLDYALLGRWIGHFPKGRFFHPRIGATAPVRGERPLGWLAHYAIGVTFAFLLLGICGLDWAHSPTVAPPMLVGLATIVAPWFIMQPAMGAGVAGSKTPNPTATRLRNLGTHAVYGLGLYLTALTITLLPTV